MIIKQSNTILTFKVPVKQLQATFYSKILLLTPRKIKTTPKLKAALASSIRLLS